MRIAEWVIGFDGDGRVVSKAHLSSPLSLKNLMWFSQSLDRYRLSASFENKVLECYKSDLRHALNFAMFGNLRGFGACTYKP
jgi:hypothetical protein